MRWSLPARSFGPGPKCSVASVQIFVLSSSGTGDADIAPMGALIGDPTRARILTALTKGGPSGQPPGRGSRGRAVHGRRASGPAAGGGAGRRCGPRADPASTGFASPQSPRPWRRFPGSPRRSRSARCARAPTPGPCGRPAPATTASPAGGVGLLAGFLDRTGCCPAGTAASPGAGRRGPAVRSGPRPCYRLTPRGEAALGGESAWTWTRYWPGIPPSGTASTDPNSSHHLAAHSARPWLTRLFALDWCGARPAPGWCGSPRLRPGEACRTLGLPQ